MDRFTRPLQRMKKPYYTHPHKKTYITAPCRMESDLGGNDSALQRNSVVALRHDDACGGFVAGCFNRQNTHRDSCQKWEL